jgi:membrane-bound lytic murein transglycosylase
MKAIAVAFCLLSALSACGKEPPPRSVAEFMDDPILLEATMVRCGQDRALNRSDAECVNAREAVSRQAAVEAQARRQELEAQSEQKRQALRRAQQAAAEARRRAQELEQRREESEYFGEFEPLPPGQEQRESPDVAPATDDPIGLPPATDQAVPEVNPEPDFHPTASGVDDAEDPTGLL